jgi:hypothetical protein
MRLILDASGLKMNVTIHKQIIDILEESDTKGMTLNVRDANDIL